LEMFCLLVSIKTNDNLCLCPVLIE
jgi:hypothetical protein